jgi:glycosyltransferase involved in cell wall biosynthesis
MAYSIGVINPSKSEGWSSTVEQAKAYGKMVLLSNLDVHKEQNPERQFFFKTNDTKNLSKQLVYLNKNFKLNREINLFKIALKKNRFKKNTFAKHYIELVKSAIK